MHVCYCFFYHFFALHRVITSHSPHAAGSGASVPGTGPALHELGVGARMMLHDVMMWALHVHKSGRSRTHLYHIGYGLKPKICLRR